MASEVIERIYVDIRKEMYEPLVPADWARKTLDTAKQYPNLDPIILGLVTNWRPITFTAAMPAAIVDMVTAFADSFSNTTVSESSITQFGQNAIAALTRAVPELVHDEGLRNKLRLKLMEISFAIHAVENTPVKYDPDWLWKQFMTVPQFQMMLWSSQRVAFTGFFNAYEATLVRLLKFAAGLDSLRVTQKREFNKTLRDTFGDDGRDKLWTNEKLNVARLVRHSLAHAAGHITTDLQDKNHGIDVIDGKLQIAAPDNHKLVALLQECVDYLIEKSIELPAFN